MASPELILNRYFGHTRFRGSQQPAIQRVLRGQHVLLMMPTGMGKSLCYQIPAICLSEASVGQRPRALTVVLSPLVALMKDQVDVLRSRGVDAVFINSSLSAEERRSRYRTIASGEHQIVYVTPERFRKTEFRETIARRDVPLLAIDEAHCVSQWGHDFRPDYSRVAQWRRLLGNPTTIALTATATPTVQRDIIHQLGLDPSDVEVLHEGLDRPNLKLEVESTSGDDAKLEQLEAILAGSKRQRGPGIVYFTLIKTLERFSGELASRGIHHLCYHGDLGRQERRQIQDTFMRDECPLVLATNAFGMGIDKFDIRFVVHAELPGSMESYYQEIGRAGRDGLPSRCVLMYDDSDLMTQMEFIDWKNPDAAFYRHLYEMLSSEQERIEAFGYAWLNQQLQCRSRYDHRLDTALAILDRHEVVRGPRPPECFQLQGPLPDHLQQERLLAEKRQRDQKKLYALVQYVHHVANGGTPMEYILNYFGVGP